LSSTMRKRDIHLITLQARCQRLRRSSPADLLRLP
jgi:hypothetical protein